MLEQADSQVTKELDLQKLLKSFKVAKLTILSLLHPHQRMMLKRLSSRYMSEASASSINSDSSGMKNRTVDYKLIATQLL